MSIPKSNKKKWLRNFSQAILLIWLSSFLLLFNNCSGGFTANSSILSNTNSSLGEENSSPTPTVTPTTTPAVTPSTSATPSPTATISPTASPTATATATVSPTATATPNNEHYCSSLEGKQGQDISSTLLQCYSDTPSGGTLSLPAGNFYLSQQLIINKPITIKTVGKTSNSSPCAIDDSTCFSLTVATNYSSDYTDFNWRAALFGQSINNVNLINIIIDGNNAARSPSITATTGCVTYTDCGNRGGGGNMTLAECDNCSIVNSVFKNNVCAASIGFWGSSSSFKSNKVVSNGYHSSGCTISDGLTVGGGSNLQVSNNYFYDNSDVDIALLGSCTNCTISNNTVEHGGTFDGMSYAAIWVNNQDMVSSNSWTGSIISNNTINCSTNRRCGFGIVLGDKLSGSGSIEGAKFLNNSIQYPQQGIAINNGKNLTFSGNTITGAGGSFAGIPATLSIFPCLYFTTNDFAVNPTYAENITSDISYTQADFMGVLLACPVQGY